MPVNLESHTTQLHSTTMVITTKSLRLLLLPILIWSAPVSQKSRDSPFLPGACPPVSPLAVLPALYSGDWLQVASFPNVSAPLVGSGYRPDLACVTSTILANLTVINRGLDLETGLRETIRGQLLPGLAGQLGQLLELSESLGLPAEQYQVLATDYSTYAAVWNCKEFVFPGELLRREFAWVLAREALHEVPSQALEAFHSAGIDTGRLVRDDRSQC